MPEHARDAIREVVRALVRRDFAQLARDGRGGRLSAREMERAIDDYGRSLTELPPDAFDIADVIPLAGSPGVYAVDVPLWTKEEGRSDLTLSTTVVCSENSTKVEIDDLHVL